MFYTDIRYENRILYYGWVVTVAGLIILTVETGIFFTFGVFFKPILAEFGWTRTELSGVFSAFMIVRIFSSLVLGYLTDRLGVRIIVILGAILASISLFLTSRFNSLWQLYVYYSLLFSVGTSCAYIPITSAVSKWFRRKRGLATGIVVLGLGLGSMVMAPFSGFLISSYGWRQSYVILGVILLVALVGAGIFLKQIAVEENKVLDINSSSDTFSYLGCDSYTLSQALRTNAFWMQGVSWFFLSFTLYAVIIHIVSYAISIGISPIKASAVLGLIGGFSLLGRIMMGIISDKVGRKKSIVIASIIGVISLVGLLISQDLRVFYVSSFIFGFSYGGWGAQMPAMPADHFGGKNSGTILGGIFMIGGAGIAVGPWLAAYIVDSCGDYQYLFLMAIGASLLGLLFSLLIKSPNRYP